MSTITSLGAGDTGATSRGVINTNFTNLNADKIETSVLDTDGTLAANSDAKVATQKAVKTYVDTEVPSITIETGTSATYSLTTVANQRVIVWAKGRLTGAVGEEAVELKYNGVTKDTNASLGTSITLGGFALMYTETPGAATANITLEATGGASLTEIQIIVMKIS